jgi:SulP family sulfate permease
MSAMNAMGINPSLVTVHISARSRDVFAGLAASVMSVAYGLSFAALIFASPLNTWLAYGLAATFIATSIAATLVALRSSLPFVIAAPDGATSAVTATLAATVTERLIANGAPDDLLAPVMIVVALSTALTGVLLLLVGLARAGGAIRFVPYPVIGGFLSATGWLMVNGAVRVITDHGLSRATLGTLIGATTLEQIGAASTVAVALYVVLRHGRSPLLLPAVLIVGALLAHFAFANRHEPQPSTRARLDV